jgi:hypothetical protein
LFASLALLLGSGCSLLVTIDEDKYMGGGDDSPSGGTQSGNGGSTGGVTNTGGSGGSPTGGTGGSETGGAPGGGGEGTGGGNTGGGSGGEPVEIPDPLHYYPLDGSGDDEGDAETPLPATTTDGNGWRPGSGVRGGAYEVPSPGQNHYLGLNPQVASTNPFTISWWYSATIDNYLALVSKNIDSAGWDLVSDPSGQPRVRVGNSDQYFFDADLPSANSGVWTHVAVSIHENASASQDRLQVWINGERFLNETVIFSSTAINPTPSVRFGFQEGSTNLPFAGFIDEIRVYDEVLTNEQVRALYELDRP